MADYKFPTEMVELQTSEITINQTGANIKSGGLKEGFISSEYQGSL